MLSSCRQRSIIPSVRPLRPPAAVQHCRAQPFTQYRRRLLLARDSTRPQLPYLSQPTFQRRISPLDQQVLRLLSTGSRDFVRDYTYLTVKWGTATWIILTLINVVLFGISQELTERDHPTPSEWSLWTRIAYRTARVEVDAWSRQGYIDWAKVASSYLKAIARLEDPKTDGKDTLIQQDDTTGGQIMIADVGSAGLDVSGKSWQWRQGYFEALMGMAQASENLESMVRDTSRNLIFPESTVIGPSNPDPRPVSKDMESAPLEENCERPCDPPEHFYMRVLTGKGFNTKQKMDAALAYANWLEYTGLNEAATEMLKWSVDIANEPLDDMSRLRDGSFVLSTNNTSSNLLHAVTEYGAHQARIGNTATALPILLSVFRIRQQAEVTPIRAVQQRPARAADTDIDVVVQVLRKLFTPKQYPEELASGNDAFRKTSQKSCDDSELMLYIGEIMYSSSSEQAEGFSWTKRAVGIAENELHNQTALLDQAEVKKCTQCLRAGVENWKFMMREYSRLPAKDNGSSFSRWLPWISSSHPPQAAMDQDADLERLEGLRALILRHTADHDVASIRQSSKFAMYNG